MKKLFVFLFVLISLFTIRYSLFTREALAHCPLCVAGAVAGVTLTRWVGVDDSITGVWIAALLGAISFWTYSWLLKKISLKDEAKLVMKPFIYIVIFGLTLWSFYKFNLIIRMSQILGFDKLTLGMIAGGVIFYLVDGIKMRIPYGKIIVGFGSMLILSLLMFILINFFV